MMSDRLWVWVADPHERIYPDTPVGRGDEVKFVLGKNEHASGQIVVRSPCPVSGLKVVVSDLVERESGAILPARCLSWGAVGYVLVPETQRLTPDPLLPKQIIDIPQDFSQAIWLTLHIPADATPGTYTGFVDLLVERQQVGRMKVNVKVFDLSLPNGRNMSFHLNLWQHASTLAYYYQVPPWGERHWDIIRHYLRDLASRSQKVILTTIVDGPWRYTPDSMQKSMVRWIRLPDGKFTFDYTVFDRYVEMAMEEGIDRQIHAYSMRQFMRSDGVTVSFYDEATGQEVEEYLVIGTERYPSYWVAFLSAFARHLESKGWLDRTYIGIDELKNVEAFRSLVDLVHQVEPRLQVTAAFNSLDVARSLANSVAQFCLYSAYVDPAFVQERQQADDEVTWYICCVPPVPNTFVHSPPIESRLIPWMTWQQDLDGFLRWSYAFWPPKPDGNYDPFNYLRWDFRREWEGWPWPSGDMFLVYPGDDGCPLSSIRWEMLREGIQDYEYLILLRSRLLELGPAASEQAHQALDQAVALVTRGFHEYTTRSADILRARQIIVQNFLALQ